MMSMVILVTTALLALLGVPLFAVMGLSASANHYFADIDPQAVFIMFYQLADQPLLAALPLFAFTGYLLAGSSAPARLVRLANACLGWLPGGLAVVAIVALSLLTAFTGASGVAILALGGILYPAMRAAGYPERFALGIITAGGALGVLFIPSLPIILYGVVSETSIDALFRAGIVPGLLVIGLLAAIVIARGIYQRLPRQAFTWRELAGATWGAKWELPLPILVIGGIYGGWLAISEAAVVSAAYAMLVEAFIHRDIPWRRLGPIARRSAILTASILMILGMAMAVTSFMIDTEVPTRFFEFARQYMTSRIAFLIALNLFLLFVGCMMDIFAATVLIVPLILPIARQYGIDPVHLGILFLANLGIGYVTPPVGMNLFIASLRFRRPILTIAWATLPFLLVLLIALAMITWWPGLSLAIHPR
jgi:tripartite ATP-independent transporter DctM subunit